MTEASRDGSGFEPVSASGAAAKEGWARRLVAHTAFPVVLGSTLVAAHASFQAGRADIAAFALLLATAVVVAVLERLFPHHASWLHSTGDLRVDMAYVPTVTVTSQIAGAGAIWLGFQASAWASAALGATLWPAHWTIAAQLVLALVAAELPKYWAHRLEHEVDFLWRIHATHHSVPRLYFLNASRFHPLDIALDGLLGFGPLVALGAGEEVLLLFSVVSAVHGYFQHANLATRIGPLNYFFSMAELHRWHHSKTIAEANHNYGQNSSVWDLVFGTFFWPKDREPPEHIGLADLPAFPTTFWRQLASPFAWRRIRAESRALAERADTA